MLLAIYNLFTEIFTNHFATHPVVRGEMVNLINHPDKPYSKAGRNGQLHKSATQLI